MPKKYLTVNEVAQLLGVTPLTVRNWDKKGALVANRNPVNNYRLYKIEDVEALMKRMESPIPRSASNKHTEVDSPIEIIVKDIQ